MKEWSVYDMDGAGPEEAEIVMGPRTALEAAKGFALDALTDDGYSDEPRDTIRLGIRQVSKTEWKFFECTVELVPQVTATKEIDEILE